MSEFYKRGRVLVDLVIDGKLEVTKLDSDDFEAFLVMYNSTFRLAKKTIKNVEIADRVQNAIKTWQNNYNAKYMV